MAEAAGEGDQKPPSWKNAWPFFVAAGVVGLVVLGVVLVVMIIASPDGLLALARKFMRKKDATA